MTAGRPSSFTQETANAICELIAEGFTIRQICAREDMPSSTTIFRWIADNAEFREQYARAKDSQLERMADELVDIAEDGSNDWEERESKNGSTYIALNKEAIERSRLRIDTRKWLLGKLKPKKYGDKITHQGDSDHPFVVKVDSSDANL